MIAFPGKLNLSNVHFLTCLLIVGVLANAGMALAQSGGLALPEDGGPLNGTAQAGSTALARDAQTSWTNPAGLTRLESSEIMLTFQPLKMTFQFAPSSGTAVSGSSGGDQGGWIPGGALFFGAPVSDKTALGLSVTSPSGLVLDPEDDWVGRYYMTKTQLVAINIEPSIGYKLSDAWSIGGGVDFQYATFKQNIAVRRPGPEDAAVSLDGDSWQVGFSLSTLFEPSETNRLGLRYRSAVSHDLTGDLEALQGRPVSTALKMPQSVTLSSYHLVSPSVALLVDVGWQEWSAFDRTVIDIEALDGIQVEIPRNFKDTWTLALGAHLQADEKWLLMGGTSYTSAAVEDMDRTPDMPVDEQWRVSVGAEYKAGTKWRIGATYTFLDLGANAVDVTQLTPMSRVVGDYNATAHILGFYASLGF
jgi:long-chain fatty acid transport protein